MSSTQRPGARDLRSSSAVYSPPADPLTALQQPVKDTAGAAEYTGMSVSWFEKGRFNKCPDAPPYIKIGRAIRYRVSDLDAWLASRIVGGAQ